MTSGFRIQEHFHSAEARGWTRTPGKHFLKEIDIRSETGSEDVLGLSGTKGVMKKDDMLQRSSEAATYVGYKKVASGQLISNKMQAWNGMFGISPYAGITSPDYAVYRISAHVDPRFIEYSCKSKLFAAEFHCRSKGMGTGFLRLNPGEMLSTPFWLPALPEQQCITSFLDRETALIDQLIEKKQRFIDTTAVHEEVARRELLSGERCRANLRVATAAPWLSSVPQHWQVLPLRFIVQVSTGSRDSQDRVDEGQYPFYVRSMQVERINTYSFDEEAVLTSGDGAGVGKVFHYVNSKFELHQRMYAFTNFKGLSGRYFYHFMRTFFHLQMTQWSAKSTVDSVRMPFLKSMLFAVPPADQQQKLLAELDANAERATQLISATASSVLKLREFRSALITAAVTGQIDVTTWGKQGKTDRRLDKIQEEMGA